MEDTRTRLMSSQISRRSLLKGVGAVAGLGALSALLGSCGDSATPGASGAASGSGKAGARTITLSHDKGSWESWFQALSDAQAASIGISWKQTPYTDSDAYRAAIRTSSNTPSVPDVFSWFTGYAMKDLVDAGALADLTSVWEREAAGFSASLRGLYSRDGVAYGAPLFIGPWIIYYSKSVFDSAGVTPPRTWDEFMGVMDTLKGKGVTPLGCSIDWSTMYFQTFLVHTDADLWNGLMDGSIPYTDDRVLDVMNRWKGLIDGGYMLDPSVAHYGGPNGNNFATFLAEGQVAMSGMATWYGPTMTTDSFQPGADFDAFICPALPGGGKPGIAVEGAPLCAGAKGRQLDAAIESIGYFMSKEGYSVWVKESGLTSARADVESSSPVDVQVLKDMNDGGYTVVDRIFEATPPELAQAVSDELGKFMLNPADPKATLTAIQGKADAVFASL